MDHAESMSRDSVWCRVISLRPRKAQSSHDFGTWLRLGSEIEEDGPNNSRDNGSSGLVWNVGSLRRVVNEKAVEAQLFSLLGKIVIVWFSLNILID